MASMRFPPVGLKSLRALAIEIRNEMTGGGTTDDSRFSIRHIESEIKHNHGFVQREIDLANELMGVRPDQQRVKIYSCLNLMDTKDFYCACAKNGSTFKKVVLPKLYEWKGQPFMQYLGTTDMQSGFLPLSSLSEVNAYSKILNKATFFIANRAAYVFLPPRFALVDKVNILGIPEDPTETDGRCFDVWNEQWLVPEYVKAAIKDRIRRTYGNIMLTTAPTKDIVNNAQDGNQIKP